MAILKKTLFDEKLESYGVFIEDTADNSQYFKITELPDVFTGGKNAFLIQGSEELDADSIVKIQIRDSQGNIIYHEPGEGIPEYYEGTSKVVSVYIYPDTAFGPCTITILGELKEYTTNGLKVPIPENWKGVYNVRWQKQINVNPLLQNTTKIRFYRRPKVDVQEVIFPIYTINFTRPTISGSVIGTAVSPTDGDDFRFFKGETLYELNSTTSKFSSSMEGETITINGLPSAYAPTIREVVNSTKALVNIPYYETSSGDANSYQNVLSFAASPFTLSFDQSSTLTDSRISSSFAKITLTDLETFSGDVNRVKVYATRLADIGSFTLLEDIKLESNEILSSNAFSGSINVRTGVLSSQNIIDSFWIYREYNGATTYTKEIDNSLLMASVKLEDLSIQNTADAPQKLFYYSSSIDFTKNTEYQLSFNLLLSSSAYAPNKILVYGSGSSFVNTDDTLPLGKLIGEISTDKTFRRFDRQEFNFKPDADGTGTLVFAVHQGNWQVSNIGLRASQETNFSPNQVSLNVTMPTVVNNDIYDFKFEFYDINNNYVPVLVEKLYQFQGGSGATAPRIISLSSDVNIFSFSGSGAPIGANSTTLSVEKTGLSGSVVFYSSAFDDGGNYLSPSLYAGGQYPGLLTNINETPTLTTATLNASAFTGSLTSVKVTRLVYTASCDGLTDKINIYRIEEGVAGTDGSNAIQYVIRPLNGTSLKNSSGSLELQVSKIDGSSLIDLSSGNIRLVTGSLNTQISAGGGVTAGVNGLPFNAIFDSTKISGSLLVKAYDFDTNLVVDTITLVDVSDGIPAGVINSSNGLTFVRQTNNGFFFSPETSKVTASFFSPAGIEVSESIAITASYSAGNDFFKYDVLVDNPNVGLIVRAADGTTLTAGVPKATRTISTQFTYSSLRVSETFNIMADGASGSNGAPGAPSKTVNLTSPYYVIAYDKDGLNPSPSALFPITASAINFTNPFFRFTGDVNSVEGTYTAGSSSTEDSASFTPPSTYFTTPKTFRVGVAESSAPSTEIAYDTITIAAVRVGQTGLAGVSSQFYFIRPLSGSQIKNSQGTLELQAVWISGSTTFDLKSGSVVFTSASVSTAVLRSGSGVTSGSNAVQFNAKFDAAAINNSRVIYLYDTGSNTVYDSITLVDTTDGIAAGSIIADTLIFRRDPNNNLFTPATASVTASFFGTNGTEYQERYRVYPFYESSLDRMYFTLDSDNPQITASVDDGSGVRIASGFTNRIATKDLNFRVTFTDPQTFDSASTIETFYIISDGQDGDDAYTVILTNDSHTLPTTNTGTVTYTNSGTNILVYKGGTQLQATLSANPGTGFYSASVSSSSNITPGNLSVVGLSNVVADHSSMTADQASILYRINCEGTQSVLKLQTLSKANQGAASRAVNLTSPNYIISYDKDGLNPSPASLFPITASAVNFISPYFRFTGDVNSVEGTYTAGSSSAEDTASFTPPSTFSSFGAPKTFRVGVAEATAPSVELAFDTITIAAVKPGFTGDTGGSSQFYFIRPLSGSQIKNSQGSLELQAVWISGSTTYDLKSGSIVLTSGSVGTSVLRSGSGVTSGSNAVQFNAKFDANAISGSRIIYLYDTGSNRLYDSITLIDTSDGVAAGSIIADTLIFRRDPNNNLFTPSTASVTASFFGTNGIEYQERYRVYPFYETALDKMYFTLDSDNPQITASVDDGSGLRIASGFANRITTKDLNFRVTFTDPQTFDSSSTLETFYIISDGQDGDDAYTVLLTNDSHTLPTTNTGVVTYTNSGTDILVYKGTTQLQATLTANPGTGFYSASISTSTNITPGTISVVGLAGVVGTHSSMTADQASVLYRINCEGTQSVVKLQTLSKATQGSAAKTVNLTSPNYIISYDKDGINPSPSTLFPITASAVNFVSPLFRFTGDVNSVEGTYTAGSSSSEDTASFTPPSTYFTTPKSFRVGVSEASAPSTEISFDTITIAAVKPGFTGDTGGSSQFYFIRPLSGSQIRNSQGSLELQAVWISGSTSFDLKSGSVVLTSGSVGTAVLRSGSGVTSGSNAVQFNAKLDANAISGSRIIYLYDTGSNRLYDSITLIDTSDGIAAGSIIADTLIFRRDPNNNLFTPTTASVTASFFGTNGIEYQERYRVYPFYEAAVDKMYFTLDSDSAQITASVDDGSGVRIAGGFANRVTTKDLNFKVTFTDPQTFDSSSTVETFYIISDGQDGDDAYTVLLTNDSHTLPTTNTGIVTYTNSGTDILVYKGTTQLQATTTANPGTGFYSASVSASTNITPGTVSVVGLAGVVGTHSAMTADQASVLYKINCEGTQSVVKLQTLSKATQGAAAKTVNLTSPNYIVSYDKDGLNPSPSTLFPITASAVNFVSPLFRFTGDVNSVEGTYTAGSSSSEDTASFTPPSAYFTTPRYFRVGVAEASAPSTEIAYDTITVAAVRSGQTGNDGLASQFYFIRPLSGSQIKNSQGTLELQAVWVSGSTSFDLKSGSVVLTSGSVGTAVLRSGSGVTSGSNAVQFNAKFDANAISGSRIIYLYDTGSNRLYDSITLVDSSDGLTAGSIIADTLIFRRDPNNNLFTPATASVTASFFGTNGAEYQERYRVYPFYESSLDKMYFTLDSDNVRITASIDDGSGLRLASGFANRVTTRDLNFKVTFVDPQTFDSASALETFYIISDGQDGDDAYTVVLTNDSHTLPTSNTGVVTYTNSGTNILVYKGTTQLQATTTANPGTGFYSASVSSSSNITPGTISVVGLNSVVSDHGSITADVASVLYRINCEGTQSVVKLQTLSRANQGAAAKSVNLNSPHYAVVYDKDGLNPTPSALFPVTASAINFVSPLFRFTGDVNSVEGTYTAGSSSSEDTASFTPPSAFSSFGTPKTIRVGVAEAASPSVEVAYDTITILGVKSGATGETGGSSQFYFIRPLSGSQIKNSQGSLELQAVWISGSTTFDLKSGSIVLASASAAGAVLRSGSGITSGSNAVQFNAKFDSTAISSSRVIYLYDTGSNRLYDTITLVDNTDGVAAGNVLVDTLIFRRDPNNNLFTPATASLTASFFGTNGTEYQERYRVYPFYETALDKMYFTLDSDSAQITASVDDGSGVRIASGFANRITTKDLNFRFTFIDPQTAKSASAIETLYIISDGQDGDDAYTVILTNDSHTLPTTNTGVVTYTNSGTNISVYKGINQLQATLSANPGTGFYSASVSASTNITPGTVSVVGLNAAVGDHSSITANVASVLYKINCEGTQSVVKLQTLSRANQGNDGATGAASKTVNLTSPNYIISYDKDGLNPSPSTLFPITASAINFTNPLFRFTGNVDSIEGTYTAGSSSTEDTASFTPPSTYFTTPRFFKVGVAESSAPSTEIAYDTITIAAVKAGFTGNDGLASQFYFIRPLSGSQIKNSQGSLELQAVWVSGSTTFDLKSGSVVLTSGSIATAVLRSGSGVTSGSNAVQFNAKFDATGISGSRVVYLYDTGSNRLYDSITLVDATDGVPAGSVIADTLIFRRDPNNNLFTPATASVTASFFGVSGIEYQERYRVYPFYEAALDKMYFTLDSDNVRITASIDDGSGVRIAGGFANRITTKDLNFRFTFIDPQTFDSSSAIETFYIISDGQDGDDAYTVVLTNDSHTLPTTNTGTVTYTNSGTNISVYKGTTQLQATLSANPGTGFYSASVSASTNITPGTLSVVGLNKVVADHSSMTADQASILYRVVCEGTQSVLKLQTLSKANQGAASKTVNLTSPNYIISYDNNGVNPTPSALFPITASAINFVSPLFRFTGDVNSIEGTYTAGSSSTEDSASFTPPASYFTTPRFIRVGVSEASAPSTEIAYDTITIAAVKAGNTGNTGGSTQFYFIRPLSGSQLRNSQGSLELQAVWISGSTSFDLKSGSIVLTSASVATAVLRSGSGVTSGSNAVQFNARFNSGSITGSRVVYLYDTGSNTLYDSITLIDVNDGLAGGTVLANSLFTRREAIGGGQFAYNPSTLPLTASFVGTSGMQYNTRITLYPSYSVARNIDSMYYSLDASTASISFTADDGNGNLYTSGSPANFRDTKDVTFRFTFTDPQTNDTSTALETFYIVSDGVDGDDSYTVLLTNDSHTLPTTNTGVITYTNSGTSIIAYRGSTELNGITTGTPIAGQFSASVVASNIIAGTVTSTGNPIVVGDHSSMTADLATVTYTINLEGSSSFTKVQSLARARQGNDGQMNLAFVITPVSGTILKNKTGTLELRLTRLSGSAVNEISGGAVVLVTGSANLPVSVGSGITAGPNGVLWNAIFDTTKISGSLVVRARDTASGITYDSITLADITDGLTAGTINATNGLILTRNPNNLHTYTPSTTAFTASFYDVRGNLYTSSLLISANYSYTLGDQLKYTINQTNANMTLAVRDSAGNTLANDTFANTTGINVRYVFVDPFSGDTVDCIETARIAVDGSKGYVLAADASRNQFVYDLDNQYAPATTNEFIDIILKRNITSGSLSILSGSNLPRLALISTTNIAEFTQSVYRLFSGNTTRDFTALGGTNASSWSYHTPSSSSRSGTYIFTQDGFTSSVQIEGTLKGSNSKNLDATADVNQFYYKMTDATLSPTGQTININVKRNNLGSTTNTITVASGSGKPVLTVGANNSSTGVQSYSLAGSSYPFSTGATTYTFTAQDLNSTNYTDSITITPIIVESQVSFNVSNDNVSLPATSNGLVPSGSFLLTSGSISVQVGSENIVYASTIANNRFSASISQSSNVGSTAVLTNNNYSIGVLTQDSGSLLLKIVYQDARGIQTSGSKVVNYSKSKAATPNVEVAVSPAAQSISSNSRGSGSATPNTLTITALEGGTSRFTSIGTPTYTNGLAGSVSTNTIVFSSTATSMTSDTGTVTIPVNFTNSEGTTGQKSVVATVSRIRNAAPTTIALFSADTQTVQSSSLVYGTPATFTVTVNEGGSNYTYDATLASNNTFFISSITGGTNSTSTVTPTTPTTDSGTTVSITISYRNSEGSTGTISKTHRVTISKQGNIGVTGADGRRTATGMVFYQITAGTAPSTPSATSYTFSTNTFGSLTANWAIGAPTYTAGNSNKYWYSTYTAVETTAGGGTAVPTFSTPVQAINFTGLVTFTSANNITDGTNFSNIVPSGSITNHIGGANVTTINGGKISTGVITSTGYTLAGGDTLGTGSYTIEGTILNLDNGSLRSKNFYIATNGDAFFKGNLAAASITTGLGYTPPTAAQVTSSVGQNIDVLGGGVLNYNPDFSISNADGRPAGAAAVRYTTSNSIITFSDSNKNALKLSAASPAEIAVGISAIRLNKDARYNISFRVKSNNNYSTGFYFRMEEIDVELPQGYTHISVGTSAPEVYGTGVREMGQGYGLTVNTGTATENGPITNAYVTYDITYVPTTTAKWASPQFIRHTAMSSDDLFIDRLTIQQDTSVKTQGSVGGWTIDGDSIFTGTKDTSGYSTSGITFYSGGSIHAPQFYIDTSGNAFFNGSITAGSITTGLGYTPPTTTDVNNANKTAGSVGGWTIDSTKIYSGTAGSDGAFNGGAGITLGSAGFISSKNFFIDSSGNANFRGSISFGTKGSGINMAPITMRSNPSASAFGGISGSSYEGVYYPNGATTENAISYNIDPFGNSSLTWECYPAGNSEADGGWESNYFDIDNSKTYKFIVYFKRYSSNGVGAGQTYWGTHGNDGSGEVALNTLDGGSYTNPYFWYGIPNELNKWYLIIGYVHGKNYTGTINQGGVYDVVTGVKQTSFVNGNPVLDWKWSSTSTRTNHRAYLYYNTFADGITKFQEFWGAGVYEVDGNEPDLNTLLDKGKSIGNGTYLGGTFLDGKNFYAPNISGSTGDFTGKITAAEGSIGGWIIDSDKLYSPPSGSNSIVKMKLEPNFIAPQFTLGDNDGAPAVVIKTGQLIDLASSAASISITWDSDKTGPSGTTTTSLNTYTYNNSAAFTVSETGLYTATISTSGISNVGDCNTGFAGYMYVGVGYQIASDSGFTNILSQGIVSSFSRTSVGQLDIPSGNSNVEVTFLNTGTHYIRSYWFRTGGGINPTVTWNGVVHNFSNFTLAKVIAYTELTDFGFQSIRSSLKYVKIQRVGSTDTMLKVGGDIEATGNITAYSSDKRLKTNVNILQNPLEKLNKLSGFTYNWNDKANELAGYDTSESIVGMFAQDVQEVLPEAVKIAPFDNDGEGNSKSGENYLTVQYEKVVPLLVEAIKELKNEIEELKTQINKK